MSSTMQAGGVYALKHRNLEIIKVVHIEVSVVHICRWRMNLKPEFLEDQSLKTDLKASILAKDEQMESPGMHMPFFLADLESVEPILLAVCPVKHADLEGFRIWRENEGGVWLKDFL
jgi:hypothetical protein